MIYKFKREFIETEVGKIIYYIRGDGPPVLLLHGYPQYSLMWEETALLLSDKYTTIIPDLRGYGESAKPKGLFDHSNYSKREMAKDMIQIMDNLKYQYFSVVGHDRGGRVAHRLSRDYSHRVQKMTVLDICPTLDMYESTNKEFATGYFHWFFLIQKFPVPEKLIQNNSSLWLKECLNKWSGGHNFEQKFDSYLDKFNNPETIHSTCEDYRASAGIDLIHDKKDYKKKLNIPIQVLWGKNTLINKCFNPIDIWQKYTKKNVVGEPLNCYHFIPEEIPDVLNQKLMQFIK